MLSKNSDIREYAKTKRVPLWSVAVALNVSEMTLIRWLRVDLSPERKAAIIKSIDELASVEIVHQEKKEA